MNYKDLEELGYIYDEDMMAYEVEHGIWVHYNDSDERWGIHDGGYHSEELVVYFYGRIEKVRDFLKLIKQIR